VRQPKTQDAVVDILPDLKGAGIPKNFWIVNAAGFVVDNCIHGSALVGLEILFVVRTCDRLIAIAGLINWCHSKIRLQLATEIPVSSLLFPFDLGWCLASIKS
jgi:hypothetical protein